MRQPDARREYHMKDHNIRTHRIMIKRSIMIVTMAVLVAGSVGALIATSVTSNEPSGRTLLASNSTTNVIAGSTTNATVGSTASSCPGGLQPMPDLAHAKIPAPEVTLSSLPAGATILYGDDCKFPNDTVVQVNLPGEANTDTVPSTGMPVGDVLSRPGAYHPASYVLVTVVGGMNEAPPTPSPSPDYTVRTITVQGHGAMAWYPSNLGLGGYNIAWIQDGDYVQVQTTRGRTDHGESGVSLSELEAVANGTRLG